MRALALVERYRMALEVIASGAAWEPGTGIAKIALSDPWGLQPVNMAAFEQAVAEDAGRLSVAEAVERARENEPEPVSPREDQEDAGGTVSPDLLPEPEPCRTREKVGDDGMTDTQRAILELIREREVVDRGMIIDQVPGVTEDKFRRAMLLLRRRGLVESHGPAVATVYKPAAEPTMPDPEPASEQVADAGRTDGYTLAGMPAAQAEVRRNGKGSDEGRLLDSVQFKPGWTITQHASRLGLHADKVSAAMRKLEAEGEVRSEPRNGRVVWVAR